MIFCDECYLLKLEETDTVADIIYSGLGNYYGDTRVANINGNPHMILKNWDGVHAIPVSIEFFEAFVKEFKKED
jgi:hypothetical protein